ncbi:hypothetical protein RHSIM_Rhsim12G0090000 [Rhododendron simsii]|uniref:Uncharacterized protein n=1 Tax=Rhododendron simsii TaxID=118357 RepID=A0A834G2X1_RHOSS|nr:hypothetical protein RHSIM_Rhsim12G0090000 [Rhododendron simsii]
MRSAAAAQIPTSFGHELRACLRCRLLYLGFIHGFGIYASNTNSIGCVINSLGNQDARTALSLRWMKIMSVLLIAPLLILMGLSQSWIQAEVGLLGGFVLKVTEFKDCLLVLTVTVIEGRFAPGCYTLAVSEALPEDLQNLCEDERVQYVPPKRV